MAVMPDPSMATIFGAEIRLPVVVDLGGEAQQAAVAGGDGGVDG